MTTMTLVEGSAVDAPAGELALVAFEAMLGAGWSERLAEALADLVRGAALGTTDEQARQLRELLAEGTTAPEGVDLAAA